MYFLLPPMSARLWICYAIVSLEIFSCLFFCNTPFFVLNNFFLFKFYSSYNLNKCTIFMLQYHIHVIFPVFIIVIIKIILVSHTIYSLLRLGSFYTPTYAYHRCTVLVRTYIFCLRNTPYSCLEFFFIFFLVSTRRDKLPNHLSTRSHLNWMFFWPTCGFYLF